MVMGTPGWMSPEQLRSTRDVDARSDVWSLGALLYNMLAGRPPYQVETIAHACASSRPDPPSRYKAEICATLDTIVLKCLEENPRERYQTVVELARALVELRPARGREASDESSEHAGARTPPERLARGMTVVPLRRRGASLISLATAVTVILGLTRTLTPRMLVRPSLSEATLNGASEAWSSAAKALAEESTPITSRPPAVPMDRIVDAGPPVAAGNVVDHENPHPKLVQAPRTAAKERSSDASSTAAMQILAHPEFGGRW
jgi:serine/threonine protein kinase